MLLTAALPARAVAFKLFSKAQKKAHSLDKQTKKSKTFVKTPKKEEPLVLPKFSKKGVWLNTKPLKDSAFEDKMTLVYFWDYTSSNCLRELTTLKKWYEQYKPYGFQIIYIHAPEFEVAGKKENVEDAVKRFKIQNPVFLDNDFKVWEAMKVRSWPTKFILNEDKKVVYTAVGEGQNVSTERKIRKFLKKLNPGVVLPQPVLKQEVQFLNMDACGAMSGETYVGYKKATWWGAKIANKDWVPSDKTLSFRDRGERVEKGFFVQGLWSNRGDYFEHARDTANLDDYLGMIYLGREVYAVLNKTDGAGAARIYVTRDKGPVPLEYRGIDLHEDAEGQTYFLLEQPRMYYLIANENDEELHELRLWTRSRGVAVNSFSFSNRCLSDFEHF